MSSMISMISMARAALGVIVGVVVVGGVGVAAGCQLAPDRGNVGLECDSSKDCDDPDLGCVGTNADTPPGTRVCMVPPGNWQCKGKFFGDAACDCGCEEQDIDCPNLLSSSCAEDGNQCPQGQNPVADNNIKCQ